MINLMQALIFLRAAILHWLGCSDASQAIARPPESFKRTESLQGLKHHA